MGLNGQKHNTASDLSYSAHSSLRLHVSLHLIPADNYVLRNTQKVGGGKEEKKDTVSVHNPG